MARKNGSLIGKQNVGAGVTYNASGIWDLNNVQTFSDANNPLQSQIVIKYLLVGGGGGGAGARTSYIRGGGGGGGGVVEGSEIAATLGSPFPVSIGGGGSAGYDYAGGTYGSQSTIVNFAPTGTITAHGGQGGRGYNGWPGSSTYATGGGVDNYSPGQKGTTTVWGQGYPGGLVPDSDSPTLRAASGGGGAGDKGSDSSPTSGGPGGPGRLSTITGSAVYYGGGGGGGATSVYHSRGLGGSGGGGNGGLAPSTGKGQGVDGTTNTGGGGGGAAVGPTAPGTQPERGGFGAPGTAIFRFPNAVTCTITAPSPSYWSGPNPIAGTNESYVQIYNSLAIEFTV